MLAALTKVNKKLRFNMGLTTIIVCRAVLTANK